MKDIVVPLEKRLKIKVFKIKRIKIKIFKGWRAPGPPSAGQPYPTTYAVSMLKSKSKDKIKINAVFDFDFNILTA